MARTVRVCSVRPWLFKPPTENARMQTKTLRRHALAALVGALLTVTAVSAKQSPHLQTGPNAEVTHDGLHRIDGTALDRAWAKPGANLGGYTKVLLVLSEMKFRDVKDPGFSHTATDFPLDDEQKRNVERIVHDAFLSELGRSKHFELTDQPGPGVLEIHGAVLDVVSHVPDQPFGRGVVFVRALGEATLV